ncbi:MAG TPA: hypothetical protein VID75_15145 [Acidimicrobiales bacterium]
MLASVTTVASCAGGSGSARSTSSSPPTAVQRGGGRVIVQGNATVDGATFDARWVGAVVLRRGLVTPCQESLPPVTNGHYAVPVFSDAESSGCGAPGARIVLWTFVNQKILHSTNSVTWPHKGGAVTFTARYAAADPAGAAPVTAEFTGGVFRGSERLPPGTRVEAYVGGTRCGIASVRNTPSFAGYILAVVGPDSVAGCTRGAPLAFRINGRSATGTNVVNSPPGPQAALDLQLP